MFLWPASFSAAPVIAVDGVLACDLKRHHGIHGRHAFAGVHQKLEQALFNAGVILVAVGAGHGNVLAQGFIKVGRERKIPARSGSRAALLSGKAFRQKAGSAA